MVRGFAISFPFCAGGGDSAALFSRGHLREVTPRFMLRIRVSASPSLSYSYPPAPPVQAPRLVGTAQPGASGSGRGGRTLHSPPEHTSPCIDFHLLERDVFPFRSCSPSC